MSVRTALGTGFELAFDHRRIVDDAVESVRGKLEHTNLATAFVGPEFTPSELRSVYEGGWGTDLEAANFRRKVLANDLAAATGPTPSPGPEGGKPAELSLARLPATALLSSPLRAPDRDKRNGQPKPQGKGDRR